MCRENFSPGLLDEIKKNFAAVASSRSVVETV